MVINKWSNFGINVVILGISGFFVQTLQKTLIPLFIFKMCIFVL